MFPQRILRPRSAFSLTSSLRKHPRIPNRNHLAFIRKLPCVVCGTRRGVEAAHVKMGNPLYGKSHPGGASKSDDAFTVPLCGAHHDEQHAMSESDFWMALAIDPLALALALFHSTGDEERAEQVIRSHREIKP
ncbi:MAG: hypothetical protein ABFD89_18580 [Bryobacteraceae bacterium]